MTCVTVDIFWKRSNTWWVDLGNQLEIPRVRQKTPYDTFSGEFPLLTKSLPDLLHSYFGMVSLAFQGEEGLARVDPALVTTERVVQHLESLSWRS